MHAFAVEVSRVVDGTTEMFYAGSPAFTTRPDDDPPNTTFRALITDISGKGRELFSGARVVGPVKASETKVVFDNHAGASGAGVFDEWLGSGTAGGKVTIRWGEIGTPYPSAWVVVNTAYVKSLSVDFDNATLALRDRLYLLDKPVVTRVFDGSGGLEGNGTAQRKFQLAIGAPGYIKIIPLDIPNGRYAVHAGGSDSRTLSGAQPPIGYLFDGGVRLVHEGYYTSESDYLTGADPSPGAFKVFAKGWDTTGGGGGNSPGPLYLRIGSPVVVELRYYPLGYLMNEGDAPTNIRPWKLSDLLNRAGLADVTPSTMAAGSVNHGAGNRLLVGDESYLDVLSDIGVFTHTAVGFTRDDRFFAFELRDPTETRDAGDTVKFTFTSRNSKNFRRVPIPGMESPVGRVTVSFGKTEAGQVSNSEEPQDQAAKEAVQRGPWQGIFTGTNDAVFAAHPGALSVDVEIVGNEFDTQAARQGWINRYLYLHGGVRDFIELECEAFSSIDEHAAAKTEALLALELGDKVELLHQRFGCTPARTFRIVRIQPNLKGAKPTVTFGLWGGPPGPATSVLGGGTASQTGGSGASTAVGKSRVSIGPWALRAKAVVDSVIGVVGRLRAGPWALRARASVVVVTTDPLFANVLLLINPSGANGSTTFVDASSFARPLTSEGDAQVQSSAMRLDGAGDYVWTNFTFPDDDAGNLCIEVVCVPNTVTGDQVLFCTRESASNVGCLFGRVGTELYFSSWGPAPGTTLASMTSSGAGLSIGVEALCSVHRNGNTWRICVDGAQVATTTSTSDGIDSPSLIYIGRDRAYPGGERDLDADIKALRVTSGATARYASFPFTPDAYPYLEA